jgi:hypothetical protein
LLELCLVQGLISEKWKKYHLKEMELFIFSSPDANTAHAFKTYDSYFWENMNVEFSVLFRLLIASVNMNLSVEFRRVLTMLYSS